MTMYKDGTQVIGTNPPAPAKPWKKGDVVPQELRQPQEVNFFPPGTAVGLKNYITKRREEANNLKEMAFIPQQPCSTMDTAAFRFDVTELIKGCDVQLSLRRESLLENTIDELTIYCADKEPGKTILLNEKNMRSRGFKLTAPFKPDSFVLNADAHMNSRGEILVVQWL